MRDDETEGVEEFIKDVKLPEPEQEPEEEIAQDKKIPWMLIGGLIVIFAIFAFVYVFREAPVASDSVVYNGFEFAFVEGLWQTEWQRDGQTYIIGLHYNPAQVEEFEISGKALRTFGQGPVFITFDPESKNFTNIALSAAELTLSLTSAFDVFPQAACTKNVTESCMNRPIITCDNTNDSVIFLVDDPVSSIEFDENCLMIQGSGSDLVKATDRFLYSWYRIQR